MILKRAFTPSELAMLAMNPAAAGAQPGMPPGGMPAGGAPPGGMPPELMAALMSAPPGGAPPGGMPTGGAPPGGTLPPEAMANAAGGYYPGGMPEQLPPEAIAQVLGQMSAGVPAEPTTEANTSGAGETVKRSTRELQEQTLLALGRIMKLILHLYQNLGWSLPPDILEDEKLVALAAGERPISTDSLLSALSGVAPGGGNMTGTVAAMPSPPPYPIPEMTAPPKTAAYYPFSLADWLEYWY